MDLALVVTAFSAAGAAATSCYRARLRRATLRDHLNATEQLSREAPEHLAAYLRALAGDRRSALINLRQDGGEDQPAPRLVTRSKRVYDMYP